MSRNHREPDALALPAGQFVDEASRGGARQGHRFGDSAFVRGGAVTGTVIDMDGGRPAGH